MRTLREIIENARSNGVAVGHFNISDSTQLNAIAEVAREMKLPVMIGVSEGERKFIGVHEAAALVKAFRDDGQEMYLNADHTKSLEGIKEAIDAGFDEVLFDGSELPIEENIQKAREAVALARAAGRDCLVEGELGYIGASSKLLDAVPEGAGLDKTDPDLALRFVTESGVDMLAPSVGNIHGMLKNMPDPRLDIERIAAIKDAVKVPLVLHGASGNSEEDIRAAIKAGIAIVHINTEIRNAYREGIEAGLAKSDEVAPYKYLGEGAEKMKEIVRAKLTLFNAI
ncbi:MAG TPA: class II fructose-bisphosphate aldolase [Pyrinomonadaceae bacterium]|jgi:fructose-bisphosphate aldolase class II|nr:class II fructose-bisphosphate aldolase [Pyrinomonadaceae bacterium]